MEKVKFSILIPVYNVEKYLHECIDSVLKQDYNNKEIILVDDGSTDNSGLICDEYASEYGFIKVFHQENAGQYQARKKALEYATGDFCIYLDSDDFWEDTLLNEVAGVIYETQCDVVLFDRRDIYKNKEVEIKLNLENGRVFEKKEKETLYQVFIETSKLANLVCKAFKRELAATCNNNNLFEGVCYGEDAYESISLLIKAEKTVYLSKCLYNYRRNVGVTRQMHPEYIEKITYTNTKIWELFKKEEIGMQDRKKQSMIAYIKRNIRNIVHCFMASPEKFKKSFEKVCQTEFYREARVYAYPKLNILEKIVLKKAEKQKYFLIYILGKLLLLKNDLRK